MEKLYFVGENYALSVGEKTFCVYAGKEQFFELNVRSMVHRDDLPDADYDVLDQIVEENSSERLRVTWTSCSALTAAKCGIGVCAWEKKTYRLEANKDAFVYTVTVTGKGTPSGVEYFVDSTVPRYGSKYEASHYLWPVAVLNNNPNALRCIAEDAVIGIQYLAPPMYCYPFTMEDSSEWFGLGAVAKPGEHNFAELHYKNASNRFHLSIPYYGQTKVDGSWEAPAIWGSGGDSALDVLQQYSEWYYDHGYAKRRRPASEDPDWWSGPFVCGWGEQGAMAPRLNVSQFDLANQAFYEELSAKIEEKNLHPTAIIIDDKWQSRYGEALPDPEKWPDMRGFVEKEHKKGRRVVLWFKTWDNEGLDADECFNFCGHPYCADPTSPKYQLRIKKLMHTLLSDEPGCYNADGFKIDFISCMPFGKGVAAHENGKYGIELIYKMFELFYTSAKAVKADALINNSCGHPYLAAFTDQARLHDYDGVMRSQKDFMKFRRDMFKAAIPEVSIDTDGAGSGSRRSMMNYMRYAPELGVPDLYQITSGEDATLTDEDWEEIRLVWEKYAQDKKENK